jgi:oligopeptide/dipeptide ABC transporter ATP-binding protein
MTATADLNRPLPATPSSREPLLRVERLSTHFHTTRGIVRALDDVSFDLHAGETLAVVGESGSGKTVLNRSILGLHTATNLARAEGRVLFDGIDLRTMPRRDLQRVWGQRIGLVSQNPMVALNPVVRVGRQITEVLRHNLGMAAGDANRRAVELLDSVGIPDPERRLREYPHQLSGGLRQRVTIAIAISCGPDLLIADEPTTALDVTVQAQILALLESLQRQHGMAMIFISHDLGVVAGLAHQVAVMYAGRIVERASAEALFGRPRMPYTEGLLAATPRIGQAGIALRVIEGRPPDMVHPPAGCRFHPRCSYAGDRCATEVPSLDELEPGHLAACWHPLTAPRSSATGTAPTTATAEGPDGR